MLQVMWDACGVKVLLTASPGRGHIHPMVPLAHALLDRGDEVLWVTGADECARLERDGFRAAPAGLGEREAMAELMRRFPEIHDMPPSETADFMFPRLFGTVRPETMIADLMPIARAWSPTLVVSEQAELAGPIAAASLGVPNVCHAFGSLLPAPRIEAASERVAPLWIEHDLEPRSFGGCYEHLYLNIYPASLQVSDGAHIPTIQDLRPGNSATSGDEHLPDWVTATSATALVYVTFGTVFSNDAALSAIIEALRELPVSVVVTVGPHGDPSALGAQPENIHVAKYIPQDQLLPHCAAVISHAGSGTFLAALGAGLPQLCVPQAADQFMNSGACARSGTGLALQPAEVSVAGVRSAVDRLLNEASFRTAAEQVSREIASMPSSHDVVDRLHRDFG